MSERLPPISGKELVRMLEARGFHVARTVGSHHVMKSADGRRTVVPVHGGNPIKKGTLLRILKDVGITTAEYRLLRK